MQMSLTSHCCCVRLKILKQAWIFSATHIITLSGSYIHRKAINKNKHPVLWRTALQAAERNVKQHVLWIVLPR